jgi:DNA polymerase III subunit delta'|tara:strand:- start:223 stop:1131 length:909 start_codon:yes stop_codon:yes gene_type:complete
MNLSPINQIQLFGLENEFNELKILYNEKKLPNKILFSGQKGIGKCTLAYHLSNFILSKGEDFEYDDKNFLINEKNKSFKLIQNGSNPNFSLIDVKPDKKNIEISQIRNLINDMSKSSFNVKPRFVLVDNIEYMNLSSINALLKILEEPPEKIFFLLIHNNKKIPSTLKSRCLNFRIALPHHKINEIIQKLLNSDITHLVNNELLDYYYTPGKIYNLLLFANENNIDLENIKLEEFLNLIIDKSYYKKESLIRYMIYDFIELFLSKNILNNKSNFLKKINNTKRFNLDEETLFLEFKNCLLNG